MKIILAVGILFSLLAASALVAQVPQDGNNFSQTNLVANDPSYNPEIVNPNLLDAWGIALRPPGAGGHIWINGAESGYDPTTLNGNMQRGDSFEYIGDVNGMPLHQDGLTPVKVDPPGFTDHGYAFVTGLVYNSAKDLANQAVEFSVPDYNVSRPGQMIITGAPYYDMTQTGQPAQNNGTSPPTTIANTTGASAFIFVTEDGCINCWRSNTTTSMLDAPIIIDYSKTSNYFPYEANCVFSGCAISVNPSSSAAYLNAGGNHLFATDFRSGNIEVFNNQWKDITTSYPFAVPDSVKNYPTPNPPNTGLHAFNIQDLNGHLYVSYADFDSNGDEGMENFPGAGLGHLVEYNEDGTLVKDFNDGGNLNSPWGVAIAPPGFGKFGGDVLVANFGDGTIAVLDPNSGNFIDFLRDSSGKPISIDGIWGLTFGNGVSLGDANSLYFTAGPMSEYDGLFGKLTFSNVPADSPTLPTLALVALGALLALIGGTLVGGEQVLARRSL